MTVVTRFLLPSLLSLLPFCPFFFPSSVFLPQLSTPPVFPLRPSLNPTPTLKHSWEIRGSAVSSPSGSEWSPATKRFRCIFTEICATSVTGIMINLYFYCTFYSFKNMTTKFLWGDLWASPLQLFVCWGIAPIESAPMIVTVSGPSWHCWLSDGKWIQPVKEYGRNNCQRFFLRTDLSWSISRNKISNVYLPDPETLILFLFTRCCLTQAAQPQLLWLLMLLCIANLLIKN